MQMPCRLVYSAEHTFFRLYCSDIYWTSGAHGEIRTPDLQILSSVALEHGGLIEPLLAIPHRMARFLLMWPDGRRKMARAPALHSQNEGSTLTSKIEIRSGLVPASE
jgi:hypothetical protein